MASKIDQALSTIIAENKPNKAWRGRGRGRGTVASTVRRQRTRPQPTNAPYELTQQNAAILLAAQQYQLQQAAAAAAAASAQQTNRNKRAAKRETVNTLSAPAPVKKLSGDTIHITNLADDVTADELKVRSRIAALDRRPPARTDRRILSVLYRNCSSPSAPSSPRSSTSTRADALLVPRPLRLYTRAPRRKRSPTTIKRKSTSGRCSSNSSEVSPQDPSLSRRRRKRMIRPHRTCRRPTR